MILYQRVYYTYGDTRAITSTSALVQQRALAQELELEEEVAALEGEMKEMVEVARTCAEGKEGDSGKYEKASLMAENRWRLFLGVHGYSEAQQPTDGMIEQFAAFMFKTRQVRSSDSRTGLGDSAVLLARYTLAQKVFPRMGYAGWQGLSAAELKDKARPYSQLLAETWVRLRRALPEMKTSAKPFVKEKCPEEAVFQAQDAVYEKMDAAEESLNSGLTRLAVMALVRATCQRPGAMGMDLFDLNGTTIWGPEGQNVLSVKDVQWSRTGMKITLLNGTSEESASRGEITFNRLKHRYFEAAAGGYEYQMSLTADAEAVARRSPDILLTYLWRRGVFAVQYAEMSAEAIAQVTVLRREKGYTGGMPPGAQIDEEEAVRRFEAGEMHYLKVVEDEPLLVKLQRGGDRAFKVKEMMARSSM